MSTSKITLILLLTTLFVSCEKSTRSCKKEKINSTFRKAVLVTENDNAKDDGEDDEELIIHGKVKKPNAVVVGGAKVETLRAVTNARVGSLYTDSLGEFKQEVDSGTYYFKVTVPGQLIPFITDTIHVVKDRTVTIIVD